MTKEGPSAEPERRERLVPFRQDVAKTVFNHRMSFNKKMTLEYRIHRSGLKVFDGEKAE